MLSVGSTGNWVSDERSRGGGERRRRGDRRGKEEGSIHTAKEHSPSRVYACTDETLCFSHTHIVALETIPTEVQKSLNEEKLKGDTQRQKKRSVGH